MDRSKTPVSSRVIELVAESKGVDPIEMPALYEYVDPDALDDLFSPNRDQQSASNSIQVQFEYTERNVLIRSVDDVVIWPKDTEDGKIPSA